MDCYLKHWRNKTLTGWLKRKRVLIVFSVHCLILKSIFPAWRENDRVKRWRAQATLTWHCKPLRWYSGEERRDCFTPLVICFTSTDRGKLSRLFTGVYLRPFKDTFLCATLLIGWITLAAGVILADFSELNAWRDRVILCIKRCLFPTLLCCIPLRR